MRRLKNVHMNKTSCIEGSSRFLLVSSLEKVLEDQTPPQMSEEQLYLANGEKGSFQVAVCSADLSEHRFFLSFTAAGQDAPGMERTYEFTCSRVHTVPCGKVCNDKFDQNYLFTDPGDYPDRLVRREKCVRNGKEGFLIEAEKGWQSYWIGMRCCAGSVSAGLSFTDVISIALEEVSDRDQIEKTDHHSCLCPAQNESEEKQLSMTAAVLSQELPELDICHTEWFHADCLADYYQVPVFSEQHWTLIENFMRSAADHQVNLILTPVFTPPLDTEIGGERTTVQLVKVYEQGDHYSFDFSLLDRWIKTALGCGIPNIEISHLFSQWGARFAPKIIVTREDGSQYRAFGWDTPASGNRYLHFLNAFLPELKAHLAQSGLLERTWFHISDEPGMDNMDEYAAAVRAVSPLLEGCHVVDALSDYDFYQKELVKIPVVSEDHIQPFLEGKTDPLWVYYCTGQCVDVPNRFISMPSCRNRILGVLLYVHHIRGFLHWGFNFYNTQYSRQHIDPHEVTDAGGSFPSGDAFLVYPEEGGIAGESIRGEILKEAMNDYRLLCLLEKRTSRETSLKAVSDAAGFQISFDRYPVNERFFRELRRRIWNNTDSFR